MSFATEIESPLQKAQLESKLDQYFDEMMESRAFMLVYRLQAKSNGQYTVFDQQDSTCGTLEVQDREQGSLLILTPSKGKDSYRSINIFLVMAGIVLYAFLKSSIKIAVIGVLASLLVYIVFGILSETNHQRLHETLITIGEAEKLEEADPFVTKSLDP